MIIVNDPPKRLANIDKHGFDPGDLTEEFFFDAVVLPAHSGRFMAVGMFEGRAISVVFAPLGTEAIAVISMRLASVKERKLL